MIRKLILFLALAAALLILALLAGQVIDPPMKEMRWDRVMGGVLVLLLVIFCLTGGADYGGGIWDLFARGARSQRQRALIRSAIGPIWEANHAWLIVIVVVLFSNFPVAFTAISNALHIPLSLMLLGIVMRGCAFIFRSYDQGNARNWGLLFSFASVFTPLMLGVCVGSLSTSSTQFDTRFSVVSGFVQSWWQPFPWAAGCFTLVLFAFLAAAYLAEFARDSVLKEDFRKRALICAVLVAVMAVLCLFSAKFNAPVLFKGLTSRFWSLPMLVLTGLVSCAAFYALWRRYYGRARILVAGQVALIVFGWAFAQYPFVFVPVTISMGAAPAHVMKISFLILLCGSALIIPSFLFLFRVFASDPVRAP